MHGELLSYLYHRLMHSDNARVAPGATFSDGLIVLIYFYAVMSNCSPRWASVKKHWPLWLRWLKLPSYSQLMRRLREPAVRQLIARVNDECRERLGHSSEKFADGKPMVVGGFSKDPDAAVGKVPDGYARGYRLHAVVDASCGAVDACDVTALDAGEPTVTRRLVRRLDLRGVLVRGDSNYDSNPLYRAVADAGGRLLAPRKKPGRGLGHRPHHPDRLRAIAELEGDAAMLAEHKRHRIRIEQAFAHLTNLPFGLAPLPNFVRRLRRVRMWVEAKVTLYHVHRILSLHNTIAA